MSQNQEIKPKVFSEEELSLMKKLGLTPDKVAALAKAAAPKPRKRTEFMQEYALKHIDICDLCGERVTTYFKMERDYTSCGEYLHSTKSSQEEYTSAEIQKKRESHHLTCACCSDRLVQKSKEELVALCIVLQRRVIK
jgi:hypothetical protein